MPVGSALIEEFLGVNLSKSPLRLEDNELTLAMNTYPVERGVPDMRPNGKLLGVAGRTIEGSLLNADPTRASNAGIIQFFDHLGQHHFLVWQYLADSTTSGKFAIRELFGMNMDGSGNVYDNITWRNVYLNTDVNSQERQYLYVTDGVFKRPGWVVQNGKLYLFLGYGNPLVLEAGVEDYKDLNLAAYGGVGLNQNYWAAKEYPWNVAVTGKPAQNINGTTVTIHMNQVVLGGVERYPNSLFTSDPTDPGDFTKVASITNKIDVGDSDDPIVAVLTVPVLGGAAAIEPYLLVLKQRSVWMIQGPLPDSTSFGDMRIVPLVRTEGCISKNTVVQTPDGIVWCSARNVYMMKPGQEPITIGDDIEQYLRTLPASPEDPAWHACWDTKNGCLRLNVPRGLAGAALDELENIDSNVGPNTYPCEQWWCDLRGDKPHWWGPMTLSGVVCMQEYREPGGPVIGLWMPLTTLSPTGVLLVAGPYLCTMSELTADRRDWAEYYTASKSPHPIQQLKTKYFTMGDPFIEKIVEAVELFFALSNPLGGEFVVSCEVSKNLNAIRRVFEQNVGTQNTQDRGNDAIVLDNGKLDSGGFGEGWHALALTPSSSAAGQRFLANVFQVTLTSKNVSGGNVRPALKVGGMGIRVRPVGRRSTGHDGH